MKTVFRSKFGWEIAIPIGVIFLGVSGLLLASQASWVGLAVLLLTFIWILHLFLNTHYTVENGMLTITCGFLYRKKIDLQALSSIRETNSILSSPATSLDRLELTWGSNQKVMVSPKDKSSFIAALQSVNSKIIYIKKN
ncbi:MAG: hypothetical protein GC205_06375 [Bacteroidetes bacterium]|nr:hypothetical protein [Bacteroidota bacterium]